MVLGLDSQTAALTNDMLVSLLLSPRASIMFMYLYNVMHIIPTWVFRVAFANEPGINNFL